MNPLLARLDRALRPAAFRRHRDRALRPRLRRRAAPRAGPTSTPSPPTPSPRPSPTPSRRWSAPSVGLDRVAAVFFNLAGADTNDAIEALQRDLSPRLAAHHAETMMNAALFARVDALLARSGGARAHARAGPGAHPLPPDVRPRRRPARRRRSATRLKAGAAAPREPRHRLRPERARRREGLDAAARPRTTSTGSPTTSSPRCAAAAAERGLRGPRRDALAQPDRALPAVLAPPRPARAGLPRLGRARRERRRAPTTAPSWPRRWRCARSGRGSSAIPTSPPTSSSPRWRRRREAVRDLLMAVWAPARARAEADAERLEELMRADGVNGALEPWDWRYYAAIRQAREHDFDEAALKPYLPLEGVLAAAFDVAGRLFGLSFTPDRGRALPPRRPRLGGAQGRPPHGRLHRRLFRPRLQAVGRLVLVLPRPEQARRRGAADRRQRLQLRQGAGGRADAPHLRRRAHALPRDGPRAARLLSDVTYEFVSGTSVARDFVELPSQLYEHWLETPEVLERARPPRRDRRADAARR